MFHNICVVSLGKAGNKGGKQSGDIFDDLLGSQGYQFPKRETGPRTINEMRKEELAKDMDPDKLKVGQRITALRMVSAVGCGVFYDTVII
jgi:hypothetical protein